MSPVGSNSPTDSPAKQVGKCGVDVEGTMEFKGCTTDLLPISDCTDSGIPFGGGASPYDCIDESFKIGEVIEGNKIGEVIEGNLTCTKWTCVGDGYKSYSGQYFAQVQETCFACHTSTPSRSPTKSPSKSPMAQVGNCAIDDPKNPGTLTFKGCTKKALPSFQCAEGPFGSGGGTFPYDCEDESFKIAEVIEGERTCIKYTCDEDGYETYSGQYVEDVQEQCVACYKPTGEPTLFPTTADPSTQPSSIPSVQPSSPPSKSSQPSSMPSKMPSSSPSYQPSMTPSFAPSLSAQPSFQPSGNPSLSSRPSSQPSSIPTLSTYPSSQPSSTPSVSSQPSSQPSYVPR